MGRDTPISRDPPDAARLRGLTLAELELVRLHPRPGVNYVSSDRTVLASAEDGVLGEAPDHGLFVHETRLLSRYRYLIDGAPPRLVSASNVAQRSWLGYFIAAPKAAGRPSLPEIAQNAVELRLSRYVGGGLHEDVDVTNFTRRPVRLDLALELDSDFAGQAETEHRRRQRGRKTVTWTAGDDGWELTTLYAAEHRYAHPDEVGTARMHRGLRLRFSNASTPPRRGRGGVRFGITLPPRGRWHCCIDLTPIVEGREFAPRYRCGAFARQDNSFERKTRSFLRDATGFSSRESGSLAGVVVGALERGKHDLAALRLFDLDIGEHAWTVAAGLPQYVALFGRDTLTAAWEAAPVVCGPAPSRPSTTRRRGATTARSPPPASIRSWSPSSGTGPATRRWCSPMSSRRSRR